MSRKRPHNPIDAATSSKRHLNVALAAELHNLRISQPSPRPLPSPHLFGKSLSPSPFLSASSPLSYSSPPSANGVHFGSEFAQSLSDATSSTQGHPSPDAAPTPFVQTPASPQSSSSSSSSSSAITMAIDSEETPDPNPDIIVEDISNLSTAENRLVIYRPPVTQAPIPVAKFDSAINPEQCFFRNSRTKDFILSALSEAELDKQKLAMVPWTRAPKSLCPTLTNAPPRVIPMPWKDEDKATVIELTDDDMDIDDIL